MQIFIAFIFGSVFGSFSSCLGYRFFNKEIGFFSKKNSICPHCKHNLSVLDLIPIFSYILLKGECRYCHHKIHIGYFVTEIWLSSVFSLIIWKFGMSIQSFSFIFIMFLLTTQSIIDFRKMMISDILTLLLIPFCIILARTNNIPWRYIFYSILFILLFFILLFIIGVVFLKKNIIGFGDIKLLPILSCVFWFENLVIFFFLCGLISLISFFILKKKQIPFIPDITIAFFLAFYFHNCRIFSI